MKLDVTRLGRAWRVDAVGVLVLGGVGALTYVLGVSPYFGERTSEMRIQGTIDSLRLKASELDTRVRELRTRLGERRTEIEQNIITIQPVDRKNQQFAEITDLAARHGLLVDQLTPKGAETENVERRLVRIPIEMAGRGSYPEFVEFLEELHEQKRDVSVRGFALQNAGSTTDRPRFSAVLSWYAEGMVASADPAQTDPK
jgi:Tfp pilus assembly protein PilO